MPFSAPVSFRQKPFWAPGAPAPAAVAFPGGPGDLNQSREANRSAFSIFRGPPSFSHSSGSIGRNISARFLY